MGPSPGNNPLQPMGGGWTERDTLTMWISARSCCGGVLIVFWPGIHYHPTPDAAQLTRTVQATTTSIACPYVKWSLYHIHFLSLPKVDNGWPSRRWPRPSTVWLRDVQVGRSVTPTSSYIIFTVTWMKLLWSSTKALDPTLCEISATFLYPRRKYWQDTSAPQY